MPFDPDAPAAPDAGLFGLPADPQQARIHVLPVPFDATASYRKGTARGPEAVLDASRQVDLLDPQFGPIHEQGIVLLPEDPSIAPLNRDTTALTQPILDRGGAVSGDRSAVERIDANCEQLNAIVHAFAARTLAAEKLPALLGGEHAVTYGNLRACAEHHAPAPIGVLQIDAHMDLRRSFCGFRWSHASVFYNVLTTIEPVRHLVQFGIRDYGAAEMDFAREHVDRITVHRDVDLWRAMDRGATFTDICRRAIEPLPELVYVSFDIDGLDPALCPDTGTPVPGGLSFNQAGALLEILRGTGRTVIGFDLCEVATGPELGLDNEWNAIVGARVLYKLCGCAMART